MKVIECPAFAESISEGDLRWEKQEGEALEQDEVVCEVETDKTSVPVPSPVAGVLRKQLVEDGATVNPGMKLAEIEVGAEGTAPAEKATEEPSKQEEPAAAPAAAAAPPAAEEAPKPAAAEPIPTTPPPTPPMPTGPSSSMPPPEPKRASPPPQSSGPSPVVRVPPADPTKEIAGTRSEHRVKMNRMRQKIAKTLKDAQNTNAMLTTFNELDMRWVELLVASFCSTAVLLKFNFQCYNAVAEGQPGCFREAAWHQAGLYVRLCQGLCLRVDTAANHQCCHRWDRNRLQGLR